MIKRIIEYCGIHKYLVLTLFVPILFAGWWATQNIPLDAIPDLSDTQVIIYSKWDRSPDIIEDQVTYPIIASLLGTPKVKAIRGFSDFGFSYVYVIFQDGTDIYWARSRVLEYLTKIQASLPSGVKTELGADATSVGWVFQYALVDKSGQHNLADLRSMQDWQMRFHLQSVPGVAEVASVGGFVRQYQVNLDPASLESYNVSINDVINAVRQSNNDIGGRLVELSGTEYMIRGRGYIKSLEDLENIAVAVNRTTDAPVTLKNLGRVELGPDMRRGIADLNGEGDTVGGIVIMRHGENALNVIERVKKKIEEIKPSLPEGVHVITTYDRSLLIKRSIATLKSTLVDELIIVSLVILLFLWHIPSALVPIVTIPVSVLLAFIPLYFMGITANIMSLAGIAISIGVLVDGAIVEVENAYKKLELWNEGGRKGDFHAVRLEALKEVGPSVFFSLLVIAVAFIPIFTLVDQEGRMFTPLAYSKNFAMAIAALLAITLDPAMRMLFTRMDYFRFSRAWVSTLVNTIFVGKYYPEEKHPISRFLFKIYHPACAFVLQYPKRTILASVLLLLTAIFPFTQLGSEFMPPLNEGSILYMPTTLPGISVTEAAALLQKQDEILKSFPEVESVFGKAGRAETSSDPAPLSMMETTIVLKPKSQWRKISYNELVAEMDKALDFAGVTNSWTMPIKARIDMLATGIRTPIGIKIFGKDLEEIQKIGLQIESILKEDKDTQSVFAERVTGGYFIDFDLKRTALARYGLTVDDAETVIASAIGGENIGTVIQGRERYPINVRYQRELRDSLPALERILVKAPSGANIPLVEIADIKITTGPAMIRNENGFLAGYVYVTPATNDIGGYIKNAKKLVTEKLQLPANGGYSMTWSGQYENMERVLKRLKVVVPLTLFLIFLLLYMNTKSAFKASLVMLAVPFSVIGAVWFLYFLDYNLSIAVWVGVIALMGLDAETGVFMLLYLDMAYDDAQKKGQLNSIDDLKEAITHGAVKRIRPKLMTVAAAFMGLLPIMWSMGTGADMMKRVAAPMVGGLITSFGMELLVYPAIYLLWKKRQLNNVHQQ